MKPVAIVNDQTGEFMYGLQGYNDIFNAKYEAVRIDEKRQYGEVGEYSLVAVYHGGFTHFVSTEKCSLIFAEVEK